MNVRQLPQSRIAEIIANLQVFAGLSADSIRRIAVGTRQISIAKGELLFNCGELALEMYILVSGQIKKYFPLTNGGEKVIALVGPEACMATAAAYLGRSHPTNAVGKADSYLLAVDRGLLLREARRDVGFACRLLGILSERVLSLTRDIENCASRSSLQRLSSYLLQGRPNSRARTYDVVLPTTKREIAATLSLTPETLSRAFNTLSSEGVIEMRKQWIRVLDCERMLGISQGGWPGVAA